MSIGDGSAHATARAGLPLSLLADTVTLTGLAGTTARHSFTLLYIYIHTRNCYCYLLLLLYLVNYISLLVLSHTRLKAVFNRYEDVEKDQNTRDRLAWTIGNGDSMHDRGVYPTEDTSRMETAKVNQEEEVDTRTIVKGGGECPKQGLISAKDLTIEHPEGRESPYHRLN